MKDEVIKNISIKKNTFQLFFRFKFEIYELIFYIIFFIPVYQGFSIGHTLLFKYDNEKDNLKYIPFSLSHDKYSQNLNKLYSMRQLK